MKYGLRFLFILTTIVAIVVAVIMMQQRHEQAMEKHQQQFSALITVVQDLPNSLPAEIKKLPGVMEQLKKANPLAPGNALSGGHSGMSTLGALEKNGEVTYQFDYHFPADETGVPTPETTIKVAVSSKVDWEKLGHHAVQITHEPNDLSVKAAKFIEATLLNHKALKEEKYLRIELTSPQGAGAK